VATIRRDRRAQASATAAQPEAGLSSTRVWFRRRRVRSRSTGSRQCSIASGERSSSHPTSAKRSCRIRSRMFALRRGGLRWAPINVKFDTVASFLRNTTTQIGQRYCDRSNSASRRVTRKAAGRFRSGWTAASDEVTPASAWRLDRAPASGFQTARCGCKRGRGRMPRRRLVPASRDIGAPR
jgi:hypothetical protein